MSSKHVSVRRDGFARHELVRQTVETNKTCDWCGSRRVRQGKKLDKMYQYGTEQDSRPGRIDWENQVFCCIGCHDTYHE